MSRITHKQIEEGGLITDPIQLRVYEWLKQFKNVWFCDGPIYPQTEFVEVPELNDTKLVPSYKTYEMYAERLCSIKVGEDGWTDQKCVSEIKYHIEKKLRQCTATNNILMIYVLDSGLWMETDIIYNPYTFEPNIGIILKCKMIPRVNGGIDVVQILSNKVSEEMAKGVDKEILNGLMNLGEKNNHMYLLIG